MVYCTTVETAVQDFFLHVALTLLLVYTFTTDYCKKATQPYFVKKRNCWK
jgi:hypothetical protein